METHQGDRHRSPLKTSIVRLAGSVRASTVLLVLLIALLPTGKALGREALLGLRDAVATGLRQNLDLEIQRLDIPLKRQDVISNEAVFDPAVEAALSAADQKLLTGVILYGDETQHTREISAGIGILKRFTTGLQSRLAFETLRVEDNFLADALDPKYRNLIVLQLTQPLLRDFGTDVNTAAVQVSKNRVELSVADYMARSQMLAGEIERIYLDLAGALAVLEFRIQSRELAETLAAGNQRRLARGMISVTEVDEARTAVVDRDEAVIRARQQVETLENQLKDLLAIAPADPLYDADIRTPPIPATVLPGPERNAALETALNKRPDLKGIRIARENTEILTDYYRNQKKPQVDLVASAGANGLSGHDRPVAILGGPHTSSLTGDYGDAFTSLFRDGGYQLSAELRFHYPLGNRAARAQYRKNRIEQRKIELLIDRTKRRIDTEIQNALVIVDRSLERVQAGERFVGLSAKTLDQETTRLNSGLSDTFRVLDYQEKQVSARIRHVMALTDYRKGLARLHQAMGTNLERYDILVSVDKSALGLPED
ncbi:TolC family protein [Desulfococcus sp.]|uniref:TolC family protein n=1 Tax=Desulfococcus sp. TaxID=2025834 RepID=UPI003D120AB4